MIESPVEIRVLDFASVSVSVSVSFLSYGVDEYRSDYAGVDELARGNVI
jgi:hypothetical protein